MKRMREARLLWPTLLTLLGLAILIALGNWQMHRLAWKEARIEKVTKRATSAPVSLDAAIGVSTATMEEDSRDVIEFMRVSVKGHFQNDREFHVWSPGKAGPAWSIITPLTLSSLPGAAGTTPLTTVLVIRGSVPDTKKAIVSRAEGNPDGEVEIIGRVRLGHVGAFSSVENTEKNEWYELDLNGMRKVLAQKPADGPPEGASRNRVMSVASFYVEAETATGGPAGPQPELSKINLTNRHLEYALTWYGLAVTLFGVYLAFAVSRLRQGR
jgi:surfeit locus 1 family protein